MEVIRCCGQDQRAPFCSLCGRRLQAFPLSDLLIHCREQADKAEEKLKSQVAKYGPGVLGSVPASERALFQRLDVAPAAATVMARNLTPDQRKDFDKIVSAAVRWRSWERALGNLMRHAAALPPEALAAPPPAAPEGRNLEV